MSCLFRKIMILLLLSVFGIAESHAQVVRISGTVRDKDGNALPYTTVRLEGTTTGCTTDNKGNFSFNGKTEGQTLVISSVGYEEFVLKLSKNTVFPLNVVLMTANYSIDEVIIRPEKEKYSNRENPAVRLIEEIISNKNAQNPFNNDYVSRKRYETFVVHPFKASAQATPSN